MHYATLVIIEPGDETHDDAVATTLEKVADKDALYDWYQIGGRWTGLLDGYDPLKDPKNIVICDICGGTGRRYNKNVKVTCNGCGG